MDDKDFLNAFMGVDILKAEGVAKVIGTVVAKLREGMVGAGMSPFEADNLICMAFGSLITAMQSMYGPPGGQQ